MLASCGGYHYKVQEKKSTSFCAVMLKALVLTESVEILLKQGKTREDSARWFTWDRAHSRTVVILSCPGWKHMPTLPIGWGSVTEVGKGSFPPSLQAFPLIVPFGCVCWADTKESGPSFVSFTCIHVRENQDVYQE
jgi:hypothetical protein